MDKKEEEFIKSALPLLAELDKLNEELKGLLKGKDNNFSVTNDPDISCMILVLTNAETLFSFCKLLFFILFIIFVINLFVYLHLLIFIFI